MADLARVPYNDDSTLKGIEGWTDIQDNTLLVYVHPTSGKMFPPSADWVTNFKFWPSRIEYINGSKGWCHTGYKPLGVWLTDYILSLMNKHSEVEHIVLVGYSMGAGVAQITCKDLEGITPTTCICIDNIITAWPQPKNMTMYYKKGGLYWLFSWLLKAKRKVCVNNKFRPLWKAHWFTNDEIEEIISDRRDYG